MVEFNNTAVQLKSICVYTYVYAYIYISHWSSYLRSTSKKIGWKLETMRPTLMHSSYIPWIVKHIIAIYLLKKRTEHSFVLSVHNCRTLLNGHNDKQIQQQKTARNNFSQPSFSKLTSRAQVVLNTSTLVPLISPLRHMYHHGDDFLSASVSFAATASSCLFTCTSWLLTLAILGLFLGLLSQHRRTRQLYSLGG